MLISLSSQGGCQKVNRMKIVYLGPTEGTAIQRIKSLGRLGHDVTVVDPHLGRFVPLIPERLIDAWCFRTGAIGIEWLVERYVFKQIGDSIFDVAFVDHGDLLNASAVAHLKKIAKVVVNYNQDNPYVSRDGGRWRMFDKTLPLYDVVATPRKSSVEPAKRAGARRVVAVNFAADEAVHRPIELNDEDRARYAAKVVFVGTWMPERGPFMLQLIERGVPLRIYGPRWHKAPEYEKLRSHIVLGELRGDEYVKAIRGASIAIGLLSKGNEDLHTTRSLEIPAIGTLFCAERTSDHLEMYKDGEEAVFFDTVDECADLCLSLLKHPDRIKEIADAGLKRVHKNGDFNEKLVMKIINGALKG
jgi:spore maturation protein CgeB